MQTLLILISLVLHIITFFIIRTQSMKMDLVKEKEKELTKQKGEIEELLSAYLFEMKEENDRFLSMLETGQEKAGAPLNQQDQEKTEKNFEPSVSLEKQNLPFVQVEKDTKKKKSHSYMPPTETYEEDTIEKSVPFQVLTMYKSGYPIESIAKEMNCGKTEIELMLKFYQEG